jgi:hypothetical protein
LEAVLPIKFVYFSLGQCLGLPIAVLESIRKTESDDEQALYGTLKLWLQQKYNTERFGPPTWRMLVEAVDQKAGGNNNELAKNIATNHPATSRQSRNYYTVFPINFGSRYVQRSYENLEKF